MSALLLFSVLSSLAVAPIQDAAAPPSAPAGRAAFAPPLTVPPAAAEDHIPMSHGDEPGTLSGRPHGKPIGLVLHRGAHPHPPPSKDPQPPPPTR